MIPTTIADRFKSIYLTLHLLDNNFRIWKQFYTSQQINFFR